MVVYLFIIVFICLFTINKCLCICCIACCGNIEASIKHEHDINRYCQNLHI